ncbi:MAG TPA: enoyl-CoA hydratase/isomerase family protein [Acidimicrobiales bacterium]|nr:enoyl-CoA hydratase/isomerase family protein [Acidimicrobiales bacterium]
MAYWHTEMGGGAAVATFVRPPRNMMSFAAVGELADLLGALAGDESVKVVVLTGGVPGYFVAHADLDDLTRIGRGEPVEGDARDWRRATDLLESVPQPVVAAVNGQAWGGGCELALACTVRVAAASAHFAQPEVNVGIIPGAGGTQRLPRAVGPGRAAELILSGRVVEAEEALRIGLVQAVLPDDGFLDAVLDWLGPMLSKPRHALAAAKQAVVQGARLPLDEGLRLEGRLFVECQTGEAALGLQQETLRRYAESGPDDRVEL